jgi:hypothetical protein
MSDSLNLEAFLADGYAGRVIALGETGSPRLDLVRRISLAVFIAAEDKGLLNCSAEEALAQIVPTEVKGM